MVRPTSSSTSTGGSAAAAAAAVFRFLPSEVAEMEARRLKQLSDGVIIPSHAVLQTLADKFSALPERAGKVVIQPRQERKDQALYFDAHVIDTQRRRHDARGCRCRFLVRYDHDSSEEIVPLSKVCRRPETDYRLQILHGARVAATTDVHTPPKEVVVDLTSNNKSPDEHKPKKQNKLMDVNTDEVTMVSSLQQEGTPGKAASPLLSETSEAGNSSSDATTKEVEASMVVEDGEVQVVPKMKEV